MRDDFDTAQDERSEARYDGTDDRELEEAARYRALMYGSESEPTDA
jgi:hypothetical protein